MTNGREYWLGTPRESLADLTDEQFADEVVALRTRLAAVEAERDGWKAAYAEAEGCTERWVKRAERAEADLKLETALQRSWKERAERAEAALARAREVLREVHHAEFCGGACHCDEFLASVLGG